MSINSIYTEELRCFDPQQQFHPIDYFHGAVLDLDSASIEEETFTIIGSVSATYNGRTISRHRLEISAPNARSFTINDPQKIHLILMHEAQILDGISWIILSEIPGHISIESPPSLAIITWDRVADEVRSWGRWRPNSRGYVAPSMVS